MIDEEMKARVGELTVALYVLIRQSGADADVASAASAKLLFGLAVNSPMPRALFLELAGEMWDWEEKTHESLTLFARGERAIEELAGVEAPAAN